MWLSEPTQALNNFIGGTIMDKTIMDEMRFDAHFCYHRNQRTAELKEPVFEICSYLDEHGFADMEDWQIEEIYLAVFCYGRYKWQK